MHYGLPVQMLVSYYKPKWNWPITTGPPVWGSFSGALPFLETVSAMKSGILSIRSYKFIEGRQSSSFLGMICISKSLPSAKEGKQNYESKLENSKSVP